MSTSSTQGDTSTDRFVKIRMREALLQVVYESWERRLATRMDKIMEANQLLNPSQDAFCLRLRGACYWHTSTYQGDKDYYPTSKLHPSLKETAHAWVDDHNKVTEEKRMVSHSLSAILGASNRIEDYLEVFPDSLHELTRSFQSVLPDAALHKRATPSSMQQLQFIHRPYLALMGQRYVMSLIF